MSAIVSTTALHEQTKVIGASLGAFKAGWLRIARALDHRAAVMRLRELDDDALKDIGLGRSEIVAAAYGLEAAPKRVKIP